MSPILGILDSAKTGPNLATNFYAIATATVTSGGNGAITFSSIPQTFKHLQIRAVLRDTSSIQGFITQKLQFNGDSGNNYSFHEINSSSNTVGTGATTSTNYIIGYNISGGGNASNVFGTSITDILDYTNTNKYKTARSLLVGETNSITYSVHEFCSGLWFNTSAITSITLNPYNNFSQYSTISLYGVK